MQRPPKRVRRVVHLLHGHAVPAQKNYELGHSQLLPLQRLVAERKRLPILAHTLFQLVHALCVATTGCRRASLLTAPAVVDDAECGRAGGRRTSRGGGGDGGLGSSAVAQAFVVGLREKAGDFPILLRFVDVAAVAVDVGDDVDTSPFA